MIPSRIWFPLSLQERAAWLQNFITVFTPIAISLGFTAAEVTALSQDNEDFQSIATTTVALDAFSKAVREFRISLTEGNIGDPPPVFPTEDFNGPPNNRPAGMFQRLVEAVDRIRAAPAYTDEIGAALGIIPSLSTPGANTPEGLMKPIIKASESFSSYKFSVNVTRLGMPGFKVQIQRNGSAPWTDAAFATSNPCEVIITPTTPNQPERILVRAILLSKNLPVGEPSDPTYVTVNP